MALQRIPEVAGVFLSHVVVGGGGVRSLGGLGIAGGRGGARSLSTVPRCVATNVTSCPTSTTATTTTTRPTFSAATLSSKRTAGLHANTLANRHRRSDKRREYATMASATSFYEFKPKDSTF